MDDPKLKDYQVSYDRIADEYVRRIYRELQHKPLDRKLLDRFCAALRDVGPACDIGCGPGHVTRYLHDQGVEICGIDLSSKMVERARHLNPRIEFRTGDMTKLDVAEATWAGIVAFYSLIHISCEEMVRALTELRRVLRPGGLLLLSFHIGNEAVHLDEMWGHKVSLDFFFFQPEEMASFLTLAGFEIEDIIERDPYPEVEHQSRRSYIFSRRAAEVPQISYKQSNRQKIRSPIF